MKEADLSDMYKNASNSVNTPTVSVSPDTLYLYSINFFSYVDSRKHTKGSWRP
jgi:hypothetical protein